MSGPKSYAVKVFDKNLKSLFLLQSEILSLMDGLKSRIVADKSGRFRISGDQFLKKNMGYVLESSNPVVSMLDGELNQNQFDAFYNEIHTHIQKQTEVKKMLQDELEWLDEVENALTFYKETETMLAKYLEDFLFLKEQIIAYVEKLEQLPDRKNDKIKEILNVNFEFHLPDFTIESLKNLDIERQMLSKSFDEACKKLGEVAKDKGIHAPAGESFAGVKLVSGNASKAKGFKTVRDFSDHIREIESLILEVKQAQKRQIFSDRLLNLRRNLVDKEPYFFIELIEEIKKCIRRQELESRLRNIGRELSSMTFVPSMQVEVRKFQQHLGSVLLKDTIKQQDT
ncbi:MAG: hypothetical protein K9H16_14820, partial [Bacteroidales bacterium]|nr:hypothetical protein [Bacteroidales bacterium]